MGRSRSSLEQVVYAFIALWLLVRIMEVFLAASSAVSVRGGGVSPLAVWATASTAVNYIFMRPRC
jgi:hypothetical protein